MILALSNNKFKKYPKKPKRLKPTAWKDLVTNLWERENHHCQVCRKYLDRDSVAAHHIISRGAWGEDTLDNLACLCKSCHLKIHNAEIKL